MKKLILVVASFLLVTQKNQAQTSPYFATGTDPKPTHKKWVPVENMSDNFDEKKLDEKKWQKNPIGNGWMWDGRPPGLFREENVKVKNGSLNVTVSQLKKTVVKNNKTFNYQGAIVRSIHPAKVGYYIECKMKANATVMSSTFWLMTKYDCEKKEELDIQECVGRLTDKTEDWAKNWDEIYHSNAIHRTTDCHPKSERVQKMVLTETKNHERFYVYGAWWKSPTEILFFLDGKYTYTLNPTVEWDMPAFIQMAIETYDWNPVPEDGGLVKSGTKEQRTTQYDWVRTWKLN
ncbi:glycosyl hydrolase [Wenyingzhuangia sp. 2_MG-2023]|uniref:glycosyl hydrolase n=1 Tax=Wenyingzhuangia sp. 2_MG-2023 TaxID=3062639 RepID=UPI0026E2F734|nr:glycosyl hydrolase [Wenyingzhuangia sp. 2_MG-2023]MDO6737841.1 glycosyl hydrolase [Wenyingzhuangia sp. 2_MG-2023]